MQSGSALSQLEQAVDVVAALERVDVGALIRIKRRLDAVVAAATSPLDDVHAARALGLSVGQLRVSRSLERRLDDLPEVRAALRAGDLSPEQAQVMVRNPEVAQKLLSIAPGLTTGELRQEARWLQERSAENEQEAFARVRRNRSMHDWADPEGLIAILLKLTPDDAAEVLAQQKAAEASTPREPGSSMSAFRADAFLTMIRSSGNASTPKMINIHVDKESLSRGWVERDGFCEVNGLGEIPVAKAKDFFDEAVIRVLMSSKNELIWSGESVPQRVKTAVSAAGRDKCGRCSEPAIDIDHDVASVNGGSDAVENLKPICSNCHRTKTLRDAPWSAKYYQRARAPDEVEDEAS